LKIGLGQTERRLFIGPLAQTKGRNVFPVKKGAYTDFASGTRKGRGGGKLECRRYFNKTEDQVERVTFNVSLMKL